MHGSKPSAHVKVGHVVHNIARVLQQYNAYCSRGAALSCHLILSWNKCRLPTRHWQRMNLLLACSVALYWSWCCSGNVLAHSSSSHTLAAKEAGICGGTQRLVKRHHDTMTYLHHDARAHVYCTYVYSFAYAHKIPKTHLTYLREYAALFSAFYVRICDKYDYI